MLIKDLPLVRSVSGLINLNSIVHSSQGNSNLILSTDSSLDDVFICQKKNHFQLTVHIHPIKFNNEPAKLHKFSPNNHAERFVFIKIKSENDTYEFRKVVAFYLNFYGVKMESTNQTIAVEQSQSDRSKKPFLPIK